MGGKQTKSKYEVNDEESSAEEDDFVKSTDFTSHTHTKNKYKALKLLTKFRQFKEMYGERLERDKILSPRTLFSEIFQKVPEEYTESDISVLEAYMEQRLKEWEREDNAATRFQKMWRGKQGRQDVYDMKEKIRQEKVRVRMDYFLECANRRRAQHDIFALSNEALHTQIVDQHHQNSGFAWLNEKIRNKVVHDHEKEHNERSDVGMRNRAVEFFVRQNYLRTWSLWNHYVKYNRQNRMASLLYLGHNFFFWKKKSKRWKRTNEIFTAIFERLYLSFKRVYFNVWWRRSRKNYKVVKSKTSRYAVLVESADLIFPVIRKKVLLDFGETY